MPITKTSPPHRGAQRLGVAMALCFAASCAAAHEGHHHGHASDGAKASSAQTGNPPIFIASTDRSFDELMGDAMVVMDDGMQRAVVSGQANHDFMTMMLPHHQGGVDMAKAVLLYTQDPEVRNLALGIIVEQQNEINIMNAWLKRHAEKAGQ